MAIYRKLRWMVVDIAYYPEGRKGLGGSLCPWGWDYPWLSVYVFGLYVCLRANFRLRRHVKRVAI